MVINDFKIAMGCRLLLFLVLVGSSCSPVLYAPTGQNVALLANKGEVGVSAAYAVTDEASGFDVKGAVAIDSSIVVTASYNRMKGGSSGDLDDWDGKADYIELGVGVFGSNPKQLLIYETVAGLGFSSLKNTRDADLANAYYLKPFIQPSIGLRSSFVDLAVTPRFAVVNYTSHHVRIGDQQERDDTNAFLEDKSTTFVFEPGVTLRLGPKHLKFQFQYVYTTFSYRDPGNYNKNFLSFGVSYMAW